MRRPIIIESVFDASKNIIFADARGKLEGRYMYRGGNHVSAYLSSFYGCAQACKFCHLTRSKQTDQTEASIESILMQAKEIVKFIHLPTDATSIYWSFMAQGDFLLHSCLRNRGDMVYLFSKLAAIGNAKGLKSKFNISTIFPRKATTETGAIDPDIERVLVANNTFSIEVYYSVYSLDPVFRAKYLPSATDPRQVIEALSRLVDAGIIKARLHYSLIAGKNDSLEGIVALRELCDEFDFDPKINLVRYNSFKETDVDKEPEESYVQEYLDKARQHFRIKSLDRVGVDVKASCGTFY